jgi:hypothetical protein
MATIEVTVCDVCRNPERGTTQFTIGEDGTNSALELCRDHAAPLRELLKRGVVTTAGATRTPKVATVRKTPARRRRTGFDSAVATMDEIEARKQG